MTTPTVSSLDLLRKAGVEIGAGPHERAPDRTTSRNGYRKREGETRVGTVQLAIPKLRRETYFSEFLELRRRSEQAFVSVIQEACVLGVSTRKVDQLVQALGTTRVSKFQVSALCQGLDERVTRVKQRPLQSRYPYVWVAGIFPNWDAALRIVNAVLMEYNDEWAAFPRRYFS